MTITVRKARPEELELCLTIRHEVFVLGQSVPPELEADGLDPSCTHFLALGPGGAVGTARLRITDDGRAKAERVAVREAARGTGAGRALMEALEGEAAARGHREIVLSAQVAVIPFYERLGYVAEGPVYDDAGIPHQMMRRTL